MKQGKLEDNQEIMKLPLHLLHFQAGWSVALLSRSAQHVQQLPLSSDQLPKRSWSHHLHTSSAGRLREIRLIQNT